MYTDLITRIRNAQQTKKEFVRVAFSNLDFAISELLAKEGFVDSVSKKGRMPKRIIEIKLRYATDGHGAVSGSKFVSTPSFARYLGYRDLKAVKQGFGMGIISTPRGVMTTRDARKQKVGGKLLFEIW